MGLIRYYRKPGLSQFKTDQIIKKFGAALSLHSIHTEQCFYADIDESVVPTSSHSPHDVLKWLFAETFEPEHLGSDSFLQKRDDRTFKLVEVGPRQNFTTAWSTNAVSICHSIGLTNIRRIERSRRYLLECTRELDGPLPAAFLDYIHDKMTECIYEQPLQQFTTGVLPRAVKWIPVVAEGRSALEKANKEEGLAFDERDLDFYTNLFKNELKRDPSDVEAFDLAQSNSEHSRHWFFGGNLVIDGVAIPHTLMALVKDTLKQNGENSIVAFCDNSSAIKGYPTLVIYPADPSCPSEYREGERMQHILFTAETHNFPTGVAPLPGAETGTGGRIRDTHATGRGSLVGAATAGYCVGALRLPGYDVPWEDAAAEYPTALASPANILIDASNGASDYGNKFGEPLIQGFTRSFAQRTPDGLRREYIKPIMFSGGVGYLDDRHIKKGEPEVGMAVVKVGGPAYRIGMGGGAASSMVGGSNTAERDFSAVQRGDAEMGQKLNRVIRACVENEMGCPSGNPIVSVHDQGAGGAGNVLKEIVYPLGAVLDKDKFILGDETLSTMEIWGAEYQEQDALLVQSGSSMQLLDKIAKRERLPMAQVGTVSGDGRAVLRDGAQNAVDLPLELVLGKMPPKTFHITRVPGVHRPLSLPPSLDVSEALSRVLKLVSVGSKRFLTNKVDRCVTGLVAQQQCVGPLHTPLSNVASISQGYLPSGIPSGASRAGTKYENLWQGAVTSIGELPIAGLVSPASMGGMVVGEAITNLAFAPVSSLSHVKCSGNWMWAAKLHGEGANMYDAAVAMHDAMVELGIAIDGGKDSLSMAAQAPRTIQDGSVQTETVKAPGTLVVSTYVTCPDISKIVTPDLKLGTKANNTDDGILLYIDLAPGYSRMAGSSLAQAWGQLGSETPSADIPLLKRGFSAIQEAIAAGLISAGHDRSDGGLAVTIVEMALAGNRGVEISLKGATSTTIIDTLFAEELGWVLEVHPTHSTKVQEIFKAHQVACHDIGRVIGHDKVKIQAGDNVFLDASLLQLREWWESTSYQLDRLQANPACVDQEWAMLMKYGGGFGVGPRYHVPFSLDFSFELRKQADRPRVAILREEGSNGDREMAAAFMLAGFEAWDVAMADLLAGTVNLAEFRGIAFVGGFSYADVLGSAKGWAASILFTPHVAQQFDSFYKREDTFSLGICNGCQLMALLGWVPSKISDITKGDYPPAQPRFISNASGRFESRWSSVRIESSNSIFLQGMAGSVLGVWSAHGEGRAFFPDPAILEDSVLKDNLAPIRYVDFDGQATEAYPFNPSGSVRGIAALSSRDGRHLALMPHPERSFLAFQAPYTTPEVLKVSTQGASPWMKMFINARSFCDKV